MTKFPKIVAYLHIGVITASATTITFNGDNTPKNDYIWVEFEEKDDAMVINKVNVNTYNLRQKYYVDPSKVNEHEEIELIIPGVVGDKQVQVEKNAFFGVCSAWLRLKLKFQEINDKFVQLPEDCSYMFADSEISESITEIDLKGANSSNVINARKMFYGCENLTKLTSISDKDILRCGKVAKLLINQAFYREV